MHDLDADQRDDGKEEELSAHSPTLSVAAPGCNGPNGLFQGSRK
jgi:hypothetical protein